MAKDPDAVVPTKKRGQPTTEDSLKKRLKVIHEEVKSVWSKAPDDEGGKAWKSDEEQYSDEDNDFQ